MDDGVPQLLYNLKVLHILPWDKQGGCMAVNTWQPA